MVPQRVELAPRGRVAVEPRLRQDPVEDDDRAVREGEAVGPESVGTRSRCGERRRERGERAGRPSTPRRRRARVRGRRRPRAAPSRGCGARARRSRTTSATRAKRTLTSTRRASARDCRSAPGTGNSARSSRPAEQVVLLRPRHAARGRRRDRASALGQPVDEREPRVHLDREPAVRRRDEDATPDAQRLADERLAAARDRRRARSRRSSSTTSKAPSANGSAHASPWTYAMPRIARPGSASPSWRPSAVIRSRPGVVLLEEVVRRAAALAAGLAERDLVDADVEHRRLRRPVASSRKSASLRLRERSEIASASRIGRRYGRSVPSRVGCAQRLPVVEDVVTPPGPYRLALMAAAASGRRRCRDGDGASAWQRPDGRVVVRAPDEPALEPARFMLALDDDTGGFHARFARDPLLGPSARALVGYRPLPASRPSRTPSSARSAVSCRGTARARRSSERSSAPAATTSPRRTRSRDSRPLELRRLGLAQHRATALARLAATLDLERLRAHPTPVVAARLAARARRSGPGRSA